MMKLRTSLLILAGGVVLGLVLFMDGTAWSRCRRFFARAVAVEATELVQPGKDTGKEDDPAKDAVMANVKAFADGYNSRDIKSVLALFSDDCVLTESDGTTLKGLKELEKELTDSFKEDPDSKLSISVESLQKVAPDVIIEEGKTTFFPDGKTLAAETDYQATHVKRGGKWLMTRVRSFNRV